MSLRDGAKKMSKSDPSDQSRINLTDDADTIMQKIKKAKTDSAPLPDHAEALAGRPEAANLVGIYAAMTDRTTTDVLAEFAGAGFGVFKTRLAEAIIAHLAPIRTRALALVEAPDHLDAVLRRGAERAAVIADPIVDEAERIVGFLGRS